MNENFSGVEIGSRINSKLKEFNWKQKDLMIATGLSKNAISNYISGIRIPDTSSIYKISIALNVSIEWLLMGNINDSASDLPTELASKQEANIHASSTELSSTENKLIYYYRSLPDKLKNMILSQAKLLSEQLLDPCTKDNTLLTSMTGGNDTNQSNVG